MACYTVVSREALAAARAAAGALKTLRTSMVDAGIVAGRAAREAQYASLLAREDELLGPATLGLLDDLVTKLRTFAGKPAAQGVDELSATADTTLGQAIKELDELAARMPAHGHHHHHKAVEGVAALEQHVTAQVMHLGQ